MECDEHSHLLVQLMDQYPTYASTNPAANDPVDEAEQDRYLSMSLLLITPQTIQLVCFHRDKDTLEMHSNVAGTGKARAKVVVVFDTQLKECSVS
jgi:hypothetical protein